MPSDRCEDKINELAWILFIVIKDQVKSKISDQYDKNYLKSEFLLAVNSEYTALGLETLSNSSINTSKLKYSFETHHVHQKKAILNSC